MRAFRLIPVLRYRLGILVTILFLILTTPLNYVAGSDNVPRNKARAAYRSGLLAETRESNYKKAISFYKESAQYGLADAMVALGNIYSDRDSPFFNKETAFRWYQMAAEKSDKFGMLELAKIHVEGRSKKSSRIKGLKALKKLAGQSHEAAFLLFNHLENDDERLFYLEKAAKAGHKEAIRLIAQAYRAGSLGLRANYRMAKNWEKQLPSE